MRSLTTETWEIASEPDDWTVTRLYAVRTGEVWVRVDDGWRVLRLPDDGEREELGVLLSWPRLLAAVGKVRNDTLAFRETWWVVNGGGKIVDVCHTAMEARLRAGLTASPIWPLQVYAGTTWQTRTLRSTVTGAPR